VSEEEDESEDLRPMDRQREAYRERERERDRKRVKREDKANERTARAAIEWAKGGEPHTESGLRESVPLDQRKKHLKAAKARAKEERRRGIPKGSEVVDLTQLSD
jgi:hypothetical protein